MQTFKKREPKWMKGKKIGTGLDAVVHIATHGSVFFRHKFMHIGFVQNWSIRQIKREVSQGHLYYAVETPHKKQEEK